MLATCLVATDLSIVAPKITQDAVDPSEAGGQPRGKCLSCFRQFEAWPDPAQQFMPKGVFENTESVANGGRRHAEFERRLFN